MNILIIYDSLYGNTEKVAQKIAEGISAGNRIQLKRVDSSKPPDVKQVDMIIVGSPTHGGRPTQAIQEFLQNLPDIMDKTVAAFDTRFSEKDHGPGLKLLMKIIGFAAEKIAGKLTAKGGTLLLPPEGFIVKDKKGPLKNGESERAISWAKKLLKGAN